MKVIKPYVMPRPFNGFNIPISIQTAYIKNYTEQKNFQFSLSLVELTKPECFYVLEEYLKSNQTVEFGFPSIVKAKRIQQSLITD